ncbi:MazG family protein [Saccharothrix syringae]|uniref:MazG family protein n=1 Tax=Saccharothrix syringae TaxID=103733 RepID=A0A5Q0GRG7_SACSY|nr:MazG family protein [Saccharothrix syringae]QFZ16657.1 MazG family protein [Saccharothrix syringae]
MTVVLVGAAQVLPAAALPALRSAAAVYAGKGVDAELLGARPAREWEHTGEPVVLVTTDLREPVAQVFLGRGSEVFAAPGARLLDAVAVMDRLRSPGGCPWDAEQDHKSLRQYLVEETYELLEAIEDGDREAMREELGDVLLQVLFHARIAAEDPDDPFTIDEVAADLVTKLVGRHPHVFAGGDPDVRDATTQQHRWEELKQVEKQRESSLDGVATGQPAIALAAKLVQRATRAGLPVDLLPEGDDTGTTLFAVTAVSKLSGEDPETELRAVARAFASRVRTAERSARATGLTTLTPTDWHTHWPTP